MITIQQMPNTNIAELYVQGPIETEDYKSIEPKLENLSNEYDKLDFLLLVESLSTGSMSPAAMWEELKMTQFFGKMGRVALISEVEWYDRLAGVVNVLPGVTLKHFEPGQRETALGWLAEA